MHDEDISKCSPIPHYGRDSLSSVFMSPLQASIKWYLSRWIILNLHFILSWYICWLGDKHESSLNLLFQATLAICSTLHLTTLHITPRREHWSSCSLLEFNTWTQTFFMKHPTLHLEFFLMVGSPYRAFTSSSSLDIYDGLEENMIVHPNSFSKPHLQYAQQIGRASCRERVLRLV